MGTRVSTYPQFKKYQEQSMKARYQDLIGHYKAGSPVWVSPLMNKKVLECLTTIPWQYRVGKQIQRWILKNKFPSLWNIPWSDSMLPNILPYYLHGLVAIFRKKYIKTLPLLGLK